LLLSRCLCACRIHLGQGGQLEWACLGLWHLRCVLSRVFCCCTRLRMHACRMACVFSSVCSLCCCRISGRMCTMQHTYAAISKVNIRDLTPVQSNSLLLCSCS
jgi:hypothetical protein